MISLSYDIDEEKLSEAISEAIKLDDNDTMFSELGAVTKAKKQLQDALEALDKVETVAKGLINSKAKQLYGEDWQTIVGQGYKITRSKTGAVYTRNPDVPTPKKFIKIVESLDTKLIDLEFDKTGTLPKGVEINPTRGESIRITIK